MDISTLATATKTGVDILDSAIDKFDKYKQIKQDTTTYLRLLYLEVINNLEVFSTIDLDQFTSAQANAPEVQTLMKLVQTEIAEGVFYKGGENANQQLYERLKKRGQIKNRDKQSVTNNKQGDEVKVNKSYTYENILQAISFVVTKIEVMRKYAELSDDELKVMKTIRLRSRLINIHQRLRMIKNSLDQMDEVKEMAR